MSEKMVITKVGGDTPVSKPVDTKPVPVAGKRKTMRTYPRGVLKVKGVKDPAKSPPLKKTSKRHTVQILTDIGAKNHRKTIRKKIKKMSNDKVRSIANKHGLLKGSGTPPSLVRDIVEGGAIAGFISLE